MRKPCLYRCICVSSLTLAAIAAAKKTFEMTKTKIIRRRDKDINCLLKSIKNAVCDDDVIDFPTYATYLDEYYNITAKRFGNEIIYTSPAFSHQISSSNIAVYSMDRLELSFSLNRQSKKAVLCDDEEESVSP